jgi:hypothetical protein
VKRSFVIAMGIGFLISSVLMGMPPMRDGSSDWARLDLPGMAAASLFWGVAGNSVIVGLAIGWAVNAIVYGLVALAVLSILKISN